MTVFKTDLAKSAALQCRSEHFGCRSVQIQRPNSSMWVFIVLSCCGERDGVSSAAAGLKLATKRRLIAMKSKVDLCRARP